MNDWAQVFFYNPGGFAMDREHFSRQEALAKIGLTIESSVEFADAPKGTSGKVTRAAQIDWDKWTVVVDWDLPQTRVQSNHWFTKFEYRKFLQEVAGSPGA
jgi:hypothetical protein